MNHARNRFALAALAGTAALLLPICSPWAAFEVGDLVRLRNERACERCELVRADLHGADLKAVRLARAKLWEATARPSGAPNHGDFVAARNGKDAANAREYHEQYVERLKTELY